MDSSVKKVLIVEDDPLIVDLIRIHLRQLPADLMSTASGQQGLAWVRQHSPDLCILDIMLPDMDGIAICRQIRQLDSRLPILMLTAKAQETDKVVGLEAGADDYLTKPFGIMEFMARVRAMLRRSSLSPAEVVAPNLVITHKALSIHTADRIVTIQGNRVELTAKEFDLLVLLAQNPGKTYSRKELLHLVWDYHFAGYEHTVTSHINRLRNKIESDFAHPIYILTSWGIGYRFAETINPTSL